MRNKYTNPLNIMSIKLYSDREELKIPVVQRELVWTKSQNQLLIDSIFKDYDIPKIYFQDVVEDGKQIHYVIDGQQRLNAILSFMKDEFEMPKDADPVEDEVIANKKYGDLSSDLQILFQGRSLDVVHLVDYSDEEIDETFLRLQNGTPLKAAEKRRAIAGEMRNVVKQLAESELFTRFCDYDNSHYSYEDIVTKVLKQFKQGIGSISAQSLQKFYEDNASITLNDVDCKKVKQAFNFLVRAFKQTENPHLKKYSSMDLAIIAYGMLSTYDLNSYPKQFAEVYLQFCNERALNNEKEEEDQNPKLIAYGNATRGDSLEYIEYRQNLLREYFIENMPYLVVKDEQRLFTAEQRAVIYRLGGGKCAECGAHVDEDGDYQADHMGNKSKEFELFAPECQFTDDTVMTAAVAEALLDVGEDASVEDIEKAVTSSMQKWGHKYPDAGYGGNFRLWLNEGKNARPYGSWGNGSAMRVSPAGWLYKDLERAREVARATANVTHNHPEGIKGAESVAAVIFLARHGWEKADIKRYVIDEFGYDLSKTLDEIRPTYHHVESCQETVPEAMTAFFEGESFEDVLRCAVSLGGDCDTLTDIACAMAEAYYDIPRDIVEAAQEYLSDDIKDVYSRFWEERLRIDLSYTETFYQARDSVGSIEEILKDLNDTDSNSLIRSLIRHSHNVQEKIALSKYLNVTKEAR